MAATTTTSRRAQRASDTTLVDRLARVGIGARGVVYLVLSYIAVSIAVSGGHDKRANSKGALEEIARQPAGPALVVLLAVGFAAYAGWRFLQAAAGDRHSDGGAELAKRVGWAGIGVVYAALCVRAAVVLTGSSGGGGGTGGPATGGAGSGGDSAFSASRVLLGHTGGREILAAVGLGVVAGGVGLAMWAGSQGFASYLRTTDMPEAVQGLARVLETGGQVIRGLVFAAIGVSLFAAAVTERARDAKGMDAALRALVHQPYGRAVLAVAAAGLAAYGAASLLECRYRSV